jgi:hypothetical protein
MVKTLPQRWEDAGHPADNALPVVKTKPPVELKSQAESIRYQEKLAKGKGK